MKVKTLLHMCRAGVKIRRLFGIGLIKIYLIDSKCPFSKSTISLHPTGEETLVHENHHPTTTATNKLLNILTTNSIPEEMGTDLLIMACGLGHRLIEKVLL